MAKVVAFTPQMAAFITALMGVLAVDDNGNIVIGGATAAPAKAAKPSKKPKKEADADDGDADEADADADDADDADGDEPGDGGSDEGDDVDADDAGDDSADGDDGDEAGGEDGDDADAGDDADTDIRDEIRPLLKKLCDKRTKEAAKALLKKFGTTSLTDMDDKKLPKFKDAVLAAIKGK